MVMVKTNPHCNQSALTHCGLARLYGDIDLQVNIGLGKGLMEPSHLLNKCWLIIKGVPWPSTWSNFRRRACELNEKTVTKIHYLMWQMKDEIWVWSKFKVMKSAQCPINSLRFRFISHQTIHSWFAAISISDLDISWSSSWVRSKVWVT